MGAHGFTGLLEPGHAMTEQWRQVVRRIERGELTWREIVDELFHGALDPEIPMGRVTRWHPETRL